MGTEENEQEYLANSTRVSSFAKRLPAGRWSFFEPGSETKFLNFPTKDAKENGTQSLN